MKKYFNRESGFTLIELLVVIGILAILLSIVLIAINPARQFAQANNTKRRSDTVAILNAISQYAADHKGVLPPGLTALGSGVIKHISDAAGAANLCTDLITTVQYLPALPSDPKAANNGAQITNCTGYDTGYEVSYDANNRVTVQIDPANEELGDFISVTR